MNIILHNKHQKISLEQLSLQLFAGCLDQGQEAPPHVLPLILLTLDFGLELYAYILQLALDSFLGVLSLVDFLGNGLLEPVELLADGEGDGACGVLPEGLFLVCAFLEGANVPGEVFIGLLVLGLRLNH